VVQKQTLSVDEAGGSGDVRRTSFECAEHLGRKCFSYQNAMERTAGMNGKKKSERRNRGHFAVRTLPSPKLHGK
jgi:hypothetical protein